MIIFIMLLSLNLYADNSELDASDLNSINKSENTKPYNNSKDLANIKDAGGEFDSLSGSSNIENIKKNNAATATSTDAFSDEEIPLDFGSNGNTKNSQQIKNLLDIPSDETVAATGNKVTDPNKIKDASKNTEKDKTEFITRKKKTFLNEEEKKHTSPKELLKTVSIEYHGAPLGEVIRAIADSTKTNVVFHSKVPLDNQVNMKLTGVTYEVALRTILDSFQLAAEIKNDIIYIDTLENLQKKREFVFSEQTAEWKKKLNLRNNSWMIEPSRIMVWQVNHAESDELLPILENMLSAFKDDPRFRLRADKRTNKIIIEGVKEALIRAKSILVNLDKQKQEILIEGRIVEASTEMSRALGVTWGSRFGLDGQRGLGTGLVFPSTVAGSLGGAGSIGATAPNPLVSMNPTQIGTMGLSFGSITGVLNLDAILKAYETENMANLIASPRIVVQDHEEAIISESTKISKTAAKLEGSAGSAASAVPTAGAGGAAAAPSAGGSSTGGQTSSDIATELTLKVRPQMTATDMIELTIDVSRTSPFAGLNNATSGSTTRSAKTKLNVRNGDTAVIGGLYQTSKRKSQGRIPILGKLPIVGFLFRSDDEEWIKTELLVMITPRLLTSKSVEGSEDVDKDKEDFL